MPGTSDSTEIPGEPGKPTMPGTSDSTEIPGESGKPAMPGTSDSTEIPGESGKPAIPGTSDSTEIPGESGKPAIPGTSESTEIPGESGKPAITGTSDSTKIPATPGTPEELETGAFPVPPKIGTEISPIPSPVPPKTYTNLNIDEKYIHPTAPETPEVTDDNTGNLKKDQTHEYTQQESDDDLSDVQSEDEQSHLKTTQKQTYRLTTTQIQNLMILQTQIRINDILKENGLDNLNLINCDLNTVNRIYELIKKAEQIISEIQIRKSSIDQIDLNSFITSHSVIKKNTETTNYQTLISSLNVLKDYLKQILDDCKSLYNIQPSTEIHSKYYSSIIDECENEKYIPLIDLYSFFLKYYKRLMVNSTFGARMLNHFLTILINLNEIKQCLDEQKINSWKLLKEEYQNNLKEETKKATEIQLNGYSDHVAGSSINQSINNSEIHLINEKIKVYKIIIRLLNELILKCQELKNNPDLETNSKIHVFNENCIYKYNIKESMIRFKLFNGLNMSQRDEILERIQRLIQSLGGFISIYDSKDCNPNNIVKILESIARLKTIKDIEKNNTNLYENLKENKILNLNLRSIKFLIKLMIDMISFCWTYVNMNKIVKLKLIIKHWVNFKPY
ncbi:mucin [Cryptosporidium ubiquitum]|uniref:Mucin n=1 Tax=Cryptosporidium ubiquitum TaxID=857276 RepID=A0A1J4ME25_9CRYT|nr:mucin [Cryptosporidium ubiquitum]OII71117.1 mucin [Cryptosporidium ubiquitum]